MARLQEDESERRAFDDEMARWGLVSPLALVEHGLRCMHAGDGGASTVGKMLAIYANEVGAASEALIAALVRAEAAERELAEARAAQGIATGAAVVVRGEAERQHARAEAIAADNARLREALERIGESRDAGRHDGEPEAYPAILDTHDAESAVYSMWTDAAAALRAQPGEEAGR